jgi:hypothetical protein
MLHLKSAFYATGKEVARNDYEASLWFRRSLHDHPQAATWLGLLYETGRGEPKDLTVARQYYAEAAAQGDMYGQVNLARMLVDGHGGPADPVEAFRWNMAAARQGSPDGLNGVGYSYLIGHGIAQDRVRGVNWLRAAAEAGQPNAMHTLGSLYLQGSYVPQSPAIAYRWLASLSAPIPPQTNGFPLHGQRWKALGRYSQQTSARPSMTTSAIGRRHRLAFPPTRIDGWRWTLKASSERAAGVNRTALLGSPLCRCIISRHQWGKTRHERCTTRSPNPRRRYRRHHGK